MTGSTDSKPSPETSGKLAPGSIYSKADQEKWYLEQKGKEVLERQKHLAKLARKQCVCDKPKVTWMDQQQHKTTRVLHRETCPKHRSWMSEWLTSPATKT